MTGYKSPSSVVWSLDNFPSCKLQLKSTSSYMRRHTRRVIMSKRGLMWCLGTSEYVFIMSFFHFWTYCGNKIWSRGLSLGALEENSNSCEHDWNKLTQHNSVKMGGANKRDGRYSVSGNKAQRVRVTKRKLGRGTKSPQTVHETGHLVSCCTELIH